MGFLNATYLIQLEIDRNKRISQFENIFSLLPSLFDLDSWRQIMDTKTNEEEKREAKLFQDGLTSTGALPGIYLCGGQTIFFSLYILIIFILLVANLCDAWE